MKVFGLGWIAVAVAFVFSDAANASYVVKQLRRRGAAQPVVLRVERVKREVRGARGLRVLRSIPRVLSEEPSQIQEIYEEVLYSDEALPRGFERLADRVPARPNGATEVRVLTEQGPKENRINLTMVGDGYTLSEKEKFFADAKRIAGDLFTGATFASYLPLFNVYAVYVESRQSGLTDGRDRRDTALGLFRTPEGSKRGISVGNPSAADNAIALAPATSYAILIANDDYYGGLGGQYAITTRSPSSGTIVLRHELGHNFGEVGEEYDGGGVYSGANAASSLQDISWTHWVQGRRMSVYETISLTGDYVWQPLAGHPYSTTFNYPQPTAQGPYEFEVRLSTVGWRTPDDVHVYMDGQRMTLEGKFHKDRSFLTFHLPSSPAPGRHTLEVRENLSDGDNLLAYARVYAHPVGTDRVPGEIGAFATFDDSGTKSYRPTSRTCLMRDMLSPRFCQIDQENMWFKFLNQVQLVDGVDVKAGNQKQVTLRTPALKGLEIHWYSVDARGTETELRELAGKTSWVAPRTQTGDFKVRVRFRTPEVRKYNANFDAAKDFRL